jgi:hypothetical protein
MGLMMRYRYGQCAFANATAPTTKRGTSAPTKSRILACPDLFLNVVDTVAEAGFITGYAREAISKLQRMLPRDGMRWNTRLLYGSLHGPLREIRPSVSLPPVTVCWVPHPFALFAKGWVRSVFTVAIGLTKEDRNLEGTESELKESGRRTIRRVPHPFAPFAKGWARSVFTVAIRLTKRQGPTKFFPERYRASGAVALEN